MAADRQSKKKKVAKLDDASSSSSSSIQSTVTDKSDIEFPKPPPEDSSISPTYDPARIPASIFSCRQATGADWSINSNESLFSITMGNNSFSRDNAFIVYKSGELLRLDEVFSHPALPPLPVADTAGPAPNEAAPPVKTTTTVVDESDTSSFAFPILTNKAEPIAKVASTQGLSLKKSSETQPPTSKSSGLSTCFSFSCCPFRRK